MSKTVLAILIASIFCIPLVIIFRYYRHKEYNCLTPEEIEALKRYQAITDIVCPSGDWEDDYSWVQ
jgi:hypothetical protein